MSKRKPRAKKQAVITPAAQLGPEPKPVALTPQQLTEMIGRCSDGLHAHGFSVPPWVLVVCEPNYDHLYFSGTVLRASDRMRMLTAALRQELLNTFSEEGSKITTIPPGNELPVRADFLELKPFEHGGKAAK